MARRTCQDDHQCRVRLPGLFWPGLFSTKRSWSQNSRYVVTASKDWNVIIWDLASDTELPRRKATVRFDVPVVSASFHPKNRFVLTHRIIT